MSYKVSSQKVGKEPVPKVQSPSEPPSSIFISSIFDDFLKTMERGDIHAKKSQKEIEEVKKLLIIKKPSKKNSSVCKSTRSKFHIHNVIVESL